MKGVKNYKKKFAALSKDEQKQVKHLQYMIDIYRIRRHKIVDRVKKRENRRPSYKQKLKDYSDSLLADGYRVNRTFKDFWEDGKIDSDKMHKPFSDLTEDPDELWENHTFAYVLDHYIKPYDESLYEYYVHATGINMYIERKAYRLDEALHDDEKIEAEKSEKETYERLIKDANDEIIRILNK